MIEVEALLQAQCHQLPPLPRMGVSPGLLELSGFPKEGGDIPHGCVILVLQPPFPLSLPSMFHKRWFASLSYFHSSFLLK